MASTAYQLLPLLRGNINGSLGGREGRKGREGGKMEGEGKEGGREKEREGGRMER